MNGRSARVVVGIKPTDVGLRAADTLSLICNRPNYATGYSVPGHIVLGEKEREREGVPFNLAPSKRPGRAGMRDYYYYYYYYIIIIIY